MRDYTQYDDMDVQGDPDVQEGGQYENLPDGEYLVNGIEGYFSKAEDDTPVFVPNWDGKMVARFNLKLADGSSKRGPAISMTRAEMCAMAVAFGVDPQTLYNEESPRFLLDVQKKINATNKTRKAGVRGGKGWAQYVSGASPEEAMYQWELVSARSHDRSEPIAFQEVTKKGMKGDYVVNVIYLTLRIVSDMWGKSTPFAGWEMDIPMYNPFDEPNGNRIRTKQGAKGGIPKDVDWFFKFRELFTPGFIHQWTRDPEQSALGIDEVANPIAVFIKEALDRKQRVVCKLGFSKSGRPVLDLLDMTAVPGGDIDLDQQRVQAMKQSKELLDLKLVIEALGKQAKITIFKPDDPKSDLLNFSMTEEGIEWAKVNLVPVWEKLGLPKTDGKRLIGNLSAADAAKLWAELNPKVVPFETDSGGF